MASSSTSNGLLRYLTLEEEMPKQIHLLSGQETPTNQGKNPRTQSIAGTADKSGLTILTHRNPTSARTSRILFSSFRFTELSV